ncbi:MAG: hypothetical protein ACRDJU_11210, partial [Actinomycetota bacterium]
MSLLSGPSNFVARRFQRLFGGRDGDRGVFAILAALVMTVMVFATALSIDIMGRVSSLRSDQAAADVIALDAARGIANGTWQTLATASALRNGVPAADVSELIGDWNPATNVFQVDPTNGQSIQVTIASKYDDWFGRSTSSLSRAAVAQIAQINSTTPCTISPCSSTTFSTAQFSIGATLAEVNAGLGRFTVANLSAVGYQGLANGSLSLGTLATDVGVGAGTVSGILNSSVTVGSLLNGYASLLNSNGDSNAGATLTALRSVLSASYAQTLNASFTLGQFLGITSGNGMTLGTSVSFLQLFNGVVQVANGKAGIQSNLGIAGVGTASVSAIMPPTVSPIGQPGVQATNSQVTATMSMPSVNLLGLVSIPLSLTVNVGGATGTLSSVDGCGTVASGIHVSTAFNNATIVVSGSVNVSLLGLGLISVSVSGNVSVPGLPPVPNSTSVPNTADFVPQTGVATASSAGLGTITNNLQVTALGIGVTASTVLAAIPVTQIINALLNNVGI